MSALVTTKVSSAWKNYKWTTLAILSCLVAVVFWPYRFVATASFVVEGMLEVSYFVIPGILVSAWVNASGAGGRIRTAFAGNQLTAVISASLIGAMTPVCGVTILPLMGGLLASGVPLAPVMAFWLSSPVTDPAMFSVTAATLGVQFAIAKTIAAFLLGVFGGLASAAISNRLWMQAPLREVGLARSFGEKAHCASTDIKYDIWKDPARIQQFNTEVWTMTKLIVICLGLAFAAEFQMQMHLDQAALADYVGKQSSWAIPLAVLVGAPAYLDGYAALPLTRGLIDHGMSPGAAMAFLVSGSVVSIWGAIAIFPVLKLKPFLFYMFLALVGSLAVGWSYDGMT